MTCGTLKAMNRVIVLSNTVGREFSSAVKTTAVRSVGDFEVVSLLTSKDCDYIQLVERIAKSSNNIFVDLEKKQPLNLKNEFNQGGNLFQSILTAINKLNLNKKLNLYPIKLNDLTVNATWKHINKEYKDISGLKLGLIGTGNIGSKLLYALTESGVKVRCFNRDINKAINVVNSVILTKPEEVISSPDVVRRIEHSIIKTSGLIVACSKLSQDLSDYIWLMNKNYRIYLIGHSLLKKNSLKIFKEKNINIQKIDVGKELLSFIIGTLATKNYDVYGKKINEGISLCSGGYLGEEGDLIVDNYDNPKWYYSVCDGTGGVSYSPNMKNLKSIEEIDNLYN